MSKEYILIIDTSDKATGIGLIGNGILKTKLWTSNKNQSEKLLPYIDKLLKKNQVKPKQLKWISVNLGPGSFTGLKIGVSVANAFGYGLNIPVIGKDHLEGTTGDRIKQLMDLKTTSKKFKQVLPTYGKPPHITKPKNNS